MLRKAGPWPLLLLAVLPPISLALHFGGRMVLGWDSEPPLRPELLMQTTLTAWRWGVDLGQPSVFGLLTQTPLALLYAALALPFGIVAAQKILLTAFFVLPALTMYYCARRLFPHDRFAPLIAGVAYALCPLLFIRYYIPILPVQLAYGLLPLLANVWLDILRNGAGARRLLALALVELAILPSAGNLAYWLVPQATAFGLALLVALVDGRQRGAKLRSLLLGIVVAALVNGFWLLPQTAFGIGEGASFATTTLNRDYTTGIRRDVAQNARLAYGLRFSAKSVVDAKDRNGPYFTYAPALATGAIAAPFYLWFFLPALAIGLRARDPRTIALGVLFAGAVFAMKGDAPPLSGILDLFYNLPIVGTIFRDSYDKLLPAAAFSASLLLPAGAAALLHALRAPRRWALALVPVLVLLAFPFWTGHMFMARPKGPTLASIPPPAAWRFARALDGVDSRVLFLPAGDNPELLAMNWPYYGVNLYVNMTSASVIASREARTNILETNAMAKQIYDAVDQRDVAHFVELTRDAGVGYVFVAHDVDPSYYGGREPRDADSFLASLGDASIAAVDGPYTLWRLRWVSPVSRELQPRAIVSSNAAALTQALAVAPYCGIGAAALMWYETVPPGAAACTISTSPAADTGAASGTAATIARVSGGALHLAVAGALRGVSVPLPRGAAIAKIRYRVVGNDPATIALVPCAQYPVEGFTPAAGPRALSLEASRLGVGGLFVPLPKLGVGWQLVALHARANAPKITATIVDQISKSAIVIVPGLNSPLTYLLFYALPGRSYELDVDGPVAFPRDDVASVSLGPMARTGTSSFIAPASTSAPCAPLGGRAYAVFDRPLSASRAAYRGTLLVRTYGVQAPGDVFARPLAAQTALFRTGTHLVGSVTVDDPIYPGAPMLVREYRQRGPARVVPIDKVMTSGEQIAASVDRNGQTMTLRSLAPDQWAYFELPPLEPGQYAVTIDSSALIGEYGAAIADAQTAAPVTGERNITSPNITLAFRALPGARYNLFFYLDILTDQTQAALRVARVAVAPIEESRLDSLDVPSVVPAHATDPNALLVERSPVPPAFAALVLDTQFDRFWTTAILHAGWPWITFPPHVIADGYKNAWIVPEPLPGRVVHFYLLDVAEYLGLAVCLATVLWLALRARARA